LFPTDAYLRQNYPDIYEWAAHGYKPSLYRGKITFFWDNEASWRSVWWRKVIEAKANEVETHHLPGTQYTLRTEYVHVLAEHLKMCLDKAQAAVLE
jgi:hypothetical protein